MPPRSRSQPQPEDASYECPACGETVHITVDPSAGDWQELVEDCPVCCRPSVLRIELDEDGNALVRAACE